MKKYIITSLLSLGLMASPMLAQPENKGSKSAFISSIVAAFGNLAGFAITSPLMYIALTEPAYLKSMAQYYYGTERKILIGTFAAILTTNIVCLAGLTASIYTAYKTYPTNEESQETAQENITKQ